MHSQQNVEISTEIPASAQAVFAAWCDEDQIRNWWGAGPDFTTGVVEMDFRVGGKYRLGMVAASGNEYVAVGEYLRIEPGRRIVFSWRWEHSDADFPTTEVEVTFSDTETGCVVRLIHRGLPDEAQRDSHEDGWKGCFESLAKYILG